MAAQTYYGTQDGQYLERAPWQRKQQPPPQDVSTAYGGQTQTPAPPPAATGLNTDSYAAPQFRPQTFGGPMAGWDAAKWGNTQHATPKYEVGRILSQFSPTVEGLGQAIAQIQQAYPGTTFNGKDKLTIPGVGTIDVLAGASSGGTGWQWGALTDAQGNPLPQGGSGIGGAGGASGLGMWGGSGVYDKMRQALMGILGQDPNAVTLQSPGVAPMYQSYAADQERMRRSRQASDMERLFAQGLGESGAADAALSSGYEDMAQNVGRYGAELMGTEHSALRDQLMKALGLSGSLYGTDLASQLSYDQLGWDMGKFQDLMNYQIMQDLMQNEGLVG